MLEPSTVLVFLILGCSCGIIHGKIVVRPAVSPAVGGSFYRFPHENGKYFEGDIILPAGLRAGSMSPRWRNGVVPYFIHRSFRPTERRAIYQAMQDIESKTCIEFKKRTNQTDFVRITNLNQGCFSYVGRSGRSQQLNLGPGCMYKTTIIHELVHAVGFWHEQSRHDRDRYININWNNIPRNYWREFQKHSNLVNFGTVYDYRSVMHYSYNAFARDRSRPTITSRRRNIALRLLGAGDNAGGLTEIDALQINRMYKCDPYRDYSYKIKSIDLYES
ncbi:Zinc metalloproteinase nas-6 [Orchesella cincta]|uniref:Metalloendopeptidase n=1 Tax=Orchesella cincta TaxID=48709 RepID=A0A1D2N167_ORCCI|nr:Zinc metalloproteinase nas-6 [Orchesella cincta]